MRQIVQTVVVFLILGTCAGLVVPAIAKVRESSQRMQCANNLKQMGLALYKYHSCKLGYPAAGFLSPETSSDNGRYSFSTMSNGLPPEKRLSWLVALVPYIEQDNVYSRIDTKQGWDAEENRFAALLGSKMFHCPGYPEGPPTSTLWSSHYVGITGVGEDAAWFPSGDPLAGFFGHYRKLTNGDLVRGASETVVATETSAAKGAWTAAGLPTARGFDPAKAHFGGNHRDGCHVVYADGSVRIIESKVSDAEWKKMVVLTTDDAQ
jgi:hypothetical protein